MRVVIDFQSYQTASRYRGIGRYSMSLASELVPLLINSGHEAVFLLNRLLDPAGDVEGIIKSRFGSSVDVAWFNPKGPVVAGEPSNSWRLSAAEVLREATLVALRADVVHVTSLLPEGWIDDFVASVGRIPTSSKLVVTHYDLIRSVMPDHYMPEGASREYYYAKVDWMKEADILLCISEYTRMEAENLLKMPAEKLVHISSAVGEEFTHFAPDPDVIEAVTKTFGLRSGSFLLYAPGGFDYRKNMNRLIEGYAGLPADLQQEYPLVIASKLGEGQREAWLWKAGDAGILPGAFVLTDYVSDEDLRALYASCHAYIFPSLHEGFGLPVLEAMACGAPVIGSSVTSIPEVIGNQPGALFDPYDVAAIQSAIMNIITNNDLHNRLKSHSKERARAFSWRRTAEYAFNAIDGLKTNLLPVTTSLPSLSEALAAINSHAGQTGSADDIQAFSAEYSRLTGVAT